MSFWTSERRVGVTVSVMLILGIAITFSIKGYKPFGKKYDVTATFNSVGMLTPGSPVRMRGVQIGQIEGVDLAEEGEGVVVRMKIDELQNIQRGTTAAIMTAGLMGEQYVELKPPRVEPSDRAYLKPGENIDGEELVDFEETKARLAQLMKDVSDLLLDAREVIADPTTKANFKNTVANLEQITHTINSVMGGPEQGQEMVKNLSETMAKANQNMDALLQLQGKVNAVLDENRGDLRTTISSARDAVVDVRDQMKSLADSLSHVSTRIDEVLAKNQGNIDETLQNIKTASEDAKATAEKLRAISERLDRGEGALGALLSDKQMEDSVRQSVEETQQLIQQGKGMVKDASETAHRVNRILSGFGVEYDASYLNEQERYGREDDSHYRNDLVVTWQDGPHKLRIGGNRIGEQNEFELTYGYKLGWIRPLGGVFESEAMAGLEVIPHDRLLLGVRGVGLTDDDQRADVYGMFRLWPHVAVRGGVEDVGDENYWFAGLRLDY